MITTLLLAAASPQSVIEAERAFAALAQSKGQWTAFRETADPQAILFWPEAVSAHKVLAELKDPPKAVSWWPTKAWQSCDGTLAVTTGGALWPDGKHGWFTTVWKRRPGGGWKWVLDHGGFADVPRAKPTTVPVTQPSSCPKVLLFPVATMGPSSDGLSRHEYVSADRTLVVNAVGGPGGHRVTVQFGGTTANQTILTDTAPRQP